MMTRAWLEVYLCQMTKNARRKFIFQEAHVLALLIIS